MAGNRERVLTVSSQTIGVHHCAKADGPVASYIGVVPANATAAADVEMRHLTYPVTGESSSFVTLAQTSAGWKVVSEGTGP